MIDPDTTVDRGHRLAHAAEATVPCLTILWHPDAARVGERALLVDVAFGGDQPLSRAAPDFAPRGEAGGRPLEDRSVSRAPLHLRGLADGALELVPSPRQGRSAVEIGGEVGGAPLDGPLRLDAAALDAGVPLTLSSSVALLLHTAAPGAGAQPDLGLVGASDGLERVRAAVRAVARESLPVMLIGETGVGKELVARALHRHGRRPDGPFVALNMAAIPAGTATATLFGHRRGAFTGAVASSPGVFEAADGGTLFLDELGDTPAEVQGMLLRALESGEIMAVGGATRRVDVRVVTAMESQARAEAEAGSLRPALLNRLDGVTIRIPPLRARRDDVGRLLRHFLQRGIADTEAGAERDPTALGAWVPAPLVARLAAYPWPGNVRELQQTTLRILIGSRGSPVARLDRLGPVPRTAPPAPPREQRSGRPPVDRDDVVDALERCQWRPTAAARLLGVSKTTLYQRMAEANIPKAADLDAAAIRAALADGDSVDDAARALRVSSRGLLLRMTQLGLLEEAR